ncbi:c-type cytochrome [Rhizorhabdus dicambivorans]|uniref:c-type cytochrome n=1 Tax=Rhizorhabdus dicambivorans TaxID=1850238 RepID=UPI001112681C|nr:cytochrome c [Rhizorhabdus dicambivorans]
MPKNLKIRGGFAKALNARLLAWDVKNQRAVWSVAHDTGGNGGTLATAGNLVFQSDGQGIFAAYDATDGRKLWSFNAYATTQGGPITYSIAGVQYVAIAVGNGGASWLAGGVTTPQRPATMQGMVLVFKLGGNAKMAEPKRFPDQKPAFAAFPTPDARTVAADAKGYAIYCASCHGFGAVSGRVMPDLGRSPIAENFNALRTVVKGGALLGNGMPSFGPELFEQDLHKIQAFLADEAKLLSMGDQRAAQK